MAKYLPGIVVLLPIIGGLIIPLIKDNHRKIRCFYIESLVLVNTILVFMALMNNTGEALEVIRFTGDLSISFRRNAVRMVNSSHVQFLRDKTCIGIWCKADQFAKDYKLHGLFSGMIISEMYEAIKEHITTTQEEIDREMLW